MIYSCLNLVKIGAVDNTQMISKNNFLGHIISKIIPRITFESYISVVQTIGSYLCRKLTESFVYQVQTIPSIIWTKLMNSCLPLVDHNIFSGILCTV